MPLLVDPAISRRKFGREVAAWRENEQEYRRRGWLLLRVGDLEAEVAFVGLMPLPNMQVPFIIPTIRLTYENYDLWPPDLTFIDIFSGLAAPPLPVAMVPSPSGGRNILITRPHGRSFLCLPGTRAYHADPEHSGDLWHLHRGLGRGRLPVICENVASTMTGIVAGIAINFQPVLALPGAGMSVQEVAAEVQQNRAAYDAAVTAFDQARSA